MIGNRPKITQFFFSVCEDAGLNVKLDLPEGRKVTRKTHDVQRESLVIIK